MIAFVAGSTGYTGREVVRELRTRGLETVAHVRPDSSRLEEWRVRFGRCGARTDATRWEAGAMAATLQALRPGLVFSLLGTTRARAARARAKRGAEEGYEAVDYGLSMLLLRATERLTPAPRFIYLSSAGAGGREDAGYLGVRGRVERALREGTVPYTIARPSFITGPDRDESRPGERIAAAMVDGVLGVASWFGAGRLRDRYRSTTSTVLAGALVRLALDPEMAGRVVESEELRSP